MRFFAYAVCLSLCQPAIASTVKPPARHGPVRTLASLTVLEDDREYLVDVVENDRTGVGRKLRIVCRSGCTRFAPFQSEAGGFPLGIFMLSDRNRLILVTWAGATTTILQVFEIQDHRAVKVFNQHSKSTPRIIERADGSLAISTTEFPRWGAGADRPPITRNWVWDGHQFVGHR